MGIYNCAETLPDAISSIINQTYTNWQLIMCDDCSTDGTYSVAESYVKQYPDKMVLVKNEQNMRLAYSLNHCLLYADGELVARMDGDDLCAPDRFEKQVRFLDEHPDIQLVGTAMQRFDKDGYHDIVYGVEHPDRFSLRRHTPFCHATIMTYKYVYDKLQGYTVAERTKRGQDYDLWFRFYAEGFSGENLKDPLYYVREDKNAVRRRTAKVRINSYKTTRIGFRLLGYPKWWIIEPTVTLIVKCLTPYFVIDIYRKMQRKGK